MVALGSDALIAIVVIIVIIVVIVVIVLICCLCRKCNQCARWSRRKAYAREDEQHERQKTERKRQFDEAQVEREEVRNQIRAKYNLNNGKMNVAVIP
ncbi:unnamed protein product [Rotaria magnacalcarata]|uniref:Uncharacterized protein n=1 Tax=Rotaria magnacalcarata TaxID=392030 RepID=A0A819PXW7_9BILA|nr:unnamed protein product [Rotaria magnacalcarata]CAF1678779.1 unnamed protein product [Rotaria magnacalcarata]CAF1933395.1 unnamed protein product [Rotaria magnacalcarata]CAF2156210.1 unnamed protein product [Rotaria magnacalcarata]CAF4022672.1 unnamed protein product [Rotaria magnacalcarata]